MKKKISDLTIREIKKLCSCQHECATCPIIHLCHFLILPIPKNINLKEFKKEIDV